jgi:hypothetical protein
MVAKMTAYAPQTNNDHQVSLLQLDGFMAPISNEETTPAGDQRAIVSMVVPKIVECAKRPRATSGM